MAVNVNIGDDLKNYLSHNGDKQSSNRFFGSNRVSQWLYHPLSNNDNDEPVNDNRKSFWVSPFSSSQQSESESIIPSLSRSQRIIGFIMCLIMGILCFTLASFYVPLLVFKARKFALMFTLGSLFIVSSFSVLWGPLNHLKHLFSKERLPFTIAYFGSLLATLYFALEVKSTLLTSIFAVIQVIALIWYVVSYIPGGQTGLFFFSKVVTNAAAKTLPV